MKHKYWIWLALLALLLAGCNTQQPNVTTEPTTVPVTTTLPLASDIYNDAVSAIKENVTAIVSVNTELSVGNSKFSGAEKATITYLGLGSDQLCVNVKKDATYGEYTAKISEIYLSGTAYATIWDCKFSQEMTQEDFLSRHLPAVLLDANLYETVTMDGDVINFADPTALESWLDGELISASGTATLKNGILSEVSYTATYTVGSSEQTISLTQTLGPALSNVAPTVNAEDYIGVESIDAIVLLEQAYGYLNCATDLSVSRNDRILSHAAAYLFNVQTNIHTWGDEKAPMIQIEQDLSDHDYNTGRADSTNILEVFRDGKYTHTQDDARPTTNSSVTLDIMKNYYREMLTEHIVDTEYLQTAKLSAVSGAYLAEFTLTDAFGDATCQNVCSSIFSDPNLLNNAASDYKNKELTYYLAVDQYTGLPTALGYYYEGVHTIDGQEFPLTQQVDYSIDAASLASYEEITEEPSPDKENEGATPLLYRVTGDNGQEMWLFGTIHVGDSRTGSLPQAFYDAFAASDALAIECNTDAFYEQMEDDEALSAQVSAAYFYDDGTTTKDHITDEALYEDAVKMMKASGNYHGNVPYMKVSLWGNSLDNFYLRLGYRLTSDKGMESRLMLLAEQQSKPIWEVESTMFQIQMTTGYSDALQEELLKDNVHTDAKEYWESVDELYALWCAGDEAALIEELKDDTSEMTEEELKLYEEYNKAMMIDRNAGMLDVAKQYLESGDTVFYAVGLAHLIGEDGLVFTLRDAGYTVTLVQYQ
jgi:uncharacterized protein YbaP (TraB family)